MSFIHGFCYRGFGFWSISIFVFPLYGKWFDNTPKEIEFFSKICKNFFCFKWLHRCSQTYFDRFLAAEVAQTAGKRRKFQKFVQNSKIQNRKFDRILMILSFIIYLQVQKYEKEGKCVFKSRNSNLKKKFSARIKH